MIPFVEYQRKIINALTYFGVCTHYIDRDKDGNFIIRQNGRIRRLYFYCGTINVLIKMIYLFLTYQGWLLHVGFLDQISIWDWTFCFFLFVQSVYMYVRKYPLYEILVANWKIQEDIFKKLGSPKSMDRIIRKKFGTIVYIHTTICFGGSVALLVQFFSAPKYVLNTFAIVPYDNWLLEFIFGAHENFFMFHAWCVAASGFSISQIYAISYTHLMDEMTEVMKHLSKGGKVKEGTRKAEKTSKSRDMKLPMLRSHNGNDGIKNSKHFLPDRILDTKAVSPGTGYDVLTLLHDYKKIMMINKEWNGWVGKCVGGLYAIYHPQFVSDVFMVIQLLKEPDTAFMDVFFFFEDAVVGMFMMFRMLIIISWVFKASEGFLNAFKDYLQHETPERRYLLKYQKTLKIVAFKLAGFSTNPECVPNGFNLLINYYIGAAIWERPKDRLT